MALSERHYDTILAPWITEKGTLLLKKLLKRSLR